MRNLYREVDIMKRTSLAKSPSSMSISGFRKKHGGGSAVEDAFQIVKFTDEALSKRNDQAMGSIEGRRAQVAVRVLKSKQMDFKDEWLV
jgi:hypothetical protein